VPNKKIACKIIRILGNRIDVSLRRASAKEKAEVMERYKQEQQVKSAFNQILKEKAKETEDKILKDFSSLKEFINKSKEDTSLIKKFIPEAFHEQIKKVSQKKQKEIEVKKNFKLKCMENDGIKRIRNILNFEAKDTRITYLAAGNYLITVKSENYKDANKKAAEVIDGIEKQSKSNKCEFSAEEK
jgi:translation initiation factor 2 alpha subunit (eIF-2alpha)